MVGTILKAVALGRLTRLGPVGIALAAYGIWRRLSPEDQARVRQRVRSLLARARSRTPAAPAEPAH